MKKKIIRLRTMVSLFLANWPWHESKSFIFLNFYFSGLMACGILVPWLGIEPAHPAEEAWSPNLWTTREVPNHLFFTGEKLHGTFQEGDPKGPQFRSQISGASLSVGTVTSPVLSSQISPSLNVIHISCPSSQNNICNIYSGLVDKWCNSWKNLAIFLIKFVWWPHVSPKAIEVSSKKHPLISGLCLLRLIP